MTLGGVVLRPAVVRIDGVGPPAPSNRFFELSKRVHDAKTLASLVVRDRPAAVRAARLRECSGMFPETGEDLAHCIGPPFEVLRRKPFVGAVHVRFAFDSEACADDR